MTKKEKNKKKDKSGGGANHADRKKPGKAAGFKEFFKATREKKKRFG